MGYQDTEISLKIILSIHQSILPSALQIHKHLEGFFERLNEKYSLPPYSGLYIEKANDPFQLYILP
jgi:hypothetical protein